MVVLLFAILRMDCTLFVPYLLSVLLYLRMVVEIIVVFCDLLLYAPFSFFFFF
jgi:hypothetical protein